MSWEERVNTLKRNNGVGSKHTVYRWLWRFNGKKYRTGWNATKKQCLNEYDLIHVELVNKGTYTRDKHKKNLSLTLKEALLKYQAEELPNKKPSTAKDQFGRINQIIKQYPKLTAKPFSNIHKDDIKAFIKDRVETYNNSASTINNLLAIISHCYTYASQNWEGFSYVENPCLGVKKPSTRKNKRDGLNSANNRRTRRLKEGEEELLFNELIPKYNNYYYKFVVMFAIDTAARLSEITHMQWSNVNMSKKKILLTHTKNDDQRFVPLSNRCIKALQEISKKNGKDGYIFKTTENAISLAWQDSVKPTIPDLNFHDLRHEAISRLAKKYTNLLELASITGHKTLAMLQRYYHPDEF